MAVFDIYSVNSGSFWCARMIGIPKHFRGYFPNTDYYEDLRTNISRNSTGDKIFYTYDDTWANGAMYNNSPDIFARGWDLVLNKLTNNLGRMPPQTPPTSPTSRNRHFAVTRPNRFSPLPTGI